MKFLEKIKKETWGAVIICLLFLMLYLILALVKHFHFETGYDLAIVNQLTFEYSRFQFAVSSVNNYSFVPGLWDHFELIYIILSPFYWIWSKAETLIILQVIAVALSGIPVFLLAKKYKINTILSYALLISYFCFYGIQNALYSDVHSLVFAVSFIAFFIYFLDIGKKWPTVLFFILAVISKEDISFFTFLISFVYFVKRREKFTLYLMGLSLVYIFVILFIYFPYFTLGYRYANRNGILSDLNLFNFFNTAAKRQVIFDGLLSFGFLPLLNPLALIPFLGDLAHYFIFGSDTVTSAQSIFLHYRSSNALLLVWPTILVISKYKKLNSKYFAIYILFFSILTTYILHSPLTYLTKQWFWTTPSGVTNIQKILKYLPPDAYVVTTPNIAAHISSRNYLVLMFGDSKDFKTNSPCGKPKCAWFKWVGSPKYMVVDTSPEWNIINLLANRPDFIAGLESMEKDKTIKIYKQIGTSTIYSVLRRPY